MHRPFTSSRPTRERARRPPASRRAKDRQIGQPRFSRLSGAGGCSRSVRHANMLTVRAGPRRNRGVGGHQKRVHDGVSVTRPVLDERSRRWGASMERMALRRLFFGPRPDPDRIFLHDLWFRGHNNPRFARLAPRLPRLDGYLITVSDWRPLRAAQFRLLRSTQTLRYRFFVTSANRRYASMFTIGVEQIP